MSNNKLTFGLCMLCNEPVMDGIIDGWYTIVDLAPITPVQEIEEFAAGRVTYEFVAMATYASARARPPSVIGTPVKEGAILVAEHPHRREVSHLAPKNAEQLAPYPSNRITGERTDGQLPMKSGNLFEPPF